MIEGFIHYVEHSIVPGVGTLFAAGDDAPLDTLYLAKFLGKDVGSTYLHQAAKTPLLQDGQHQLDLAAHHVTHAAGLAAPDLVHGVVGHIPFVTLALSTTREIRLYRNDKTTLDQAIVNITVDTGGVFEASQARSWPCTSSPGRTQAESSLSSRHRRINYRAYLHQEAQAASIQGGAGKLHRANDSVFRETPGAGHRNVGNGPQRGRAGT